MNNETYLDFCFVRQHKGNFKQEIDAILSKLFAGVKVNWYLDEKIEQGAEIVIAEVKGMSRWRSEEETISYIEEQAEDSFWEYLQGFKMFIYPSTMRGCNSCAAH